MLLRYKGKNKHVYTIKLASLDICWKYLKTKRIPMQRVIAMIWG